MDSARLSRLFAHADFPADAFWGSKVFDGRELIVYGAGEGFHWVLEILMRHYAWMPSQVLDRRFEAACRFEGIPACAPRDFRPSPSQQREAVVVIAVGKPEYAAEIRATLSGMGFRTVVDLMDIYEVHNPFRLPVRLQEVGYSYFLEEKRQILAALELLADDQSREIYVRALETHMSRRPRPQPASPRDEQYFPTDVPLRRGYARFVNCGAYDGDTIRSLARTQGKVEKVACFETEPDLFARLSRYLVDSRHEIADEIVAMPCAVFSHEGLVRFRSGGGLGSRVTEDGDVLVQAVSLDHVLPGFDPTFICMDVEGAEPEALRGAERLLRTSLPDLAVCVYHAPQHLWEVLHYLHGLGLGYRFFLRNYTSFTAETVLYATA